MQDSSAMSKLEKPSTAFRNKSDTHETGKYASHSASEPATHYEIWRYYRSTGKVRAQELQDLVAPCESLYRQKNASTVGWKLCRCPSAHAISPAQPACMNIARIQSESQTQAALIDCLWAGSQCISSRRRLTCSLQSPSLLLLTSTYYSLIHVWHWSCCWRTIVSSTCGTGSIVVLEIGCRGLLIWCPT